ncbi:carboxypeptidase-like regulatory domain-containing protein [Mucilaginibacter daejeonensis]|uniref:TonB-dependent receptor n=1 Tax=Mucilaginibacter daejeonensis TaxID=398049 RepID=UPI001D172347|nr:TonB-dependent receptor [Mucilaginibacter daejeonensis]UEG54190.1 carboxypeptidase-like regulatory domain-containing protein [Mucilaginibacter daejeonensis]
MQFKKIFLTAILLAILSCAFAQTPSLPALSGKVTDSAGNALIGATVRLHGSGKQTLTDQHGAFKIVYISPGKYQLSVSMTGFKTTEQNVLIQSGHPHQLAIMLSERSHDLQTVSVTGQTAAQATRLQPYAVTVLDVKKIADRDIDINRLMDGQAGIRVQESGGLGSEFNHSIHGLSGKAVRFFVDGIPMESFGRSFSINNFSANVIDRIEVYKGVTPVELGGDALGGAINLVTRRDVQNYLDLSHSYGSFNTNRTAVSGRWRHRSGFTLQTNSFYNYSDNNYQVWGPTVEVAGEDGRPIPGFPRFRRFNDDYRAYTIKADAGFTNVKWADQLLISITKADQHRGIQTGRTMAYVYGDVRYREDLLMPSLRYSKRGFITPRLTVDMYAAFNRLNGTTIDTGSYKYKWNGEVFSGQVNGELGGIRNPAKTIYTFKDNTTLGRLNLSYQLTDRQHLNFNYTLNSTTRSGSDAVSTAEWAIPFRLPQDMNKQVAGLSYEAVVLNDRWTNTIFIKHFRYQAKASVYDYDQGSQSKMLFYRDTRDNAWGFGYAGKLLLGEHNMLKFSAENTSRLPDAIELLGDGSTILNSSSLKPEQSTNINLSLHRSFAWGTRRLQASVGTFFRDTRNLIWLGEPDLMGTARYENLDRIRTMGAEIEFNYQHNSWLEAAANATYQDIRNKQQLDPNGAASIVYNDRLRNIPYLMANGEVRFYLDQALQMKNRFTFYTNTHFVQRYYLGWPSLGASDSKFFIPSQFVQDAGLSYAFFQGRYSINLVCRNILDKQVYDNFLLQKPGRFFSLKLRYILK